MIFANRRNFLLSFWRFLPYVKINFRVIYKLKQNMPTINRTALICRILRDPESRRPVVQQSVRRKSQVFTKPLLAAHKAAGGRGHLCNSGNFRHGCVTNSDQPSANPARPDGPRRRLYSSGKPREDALKRRSSISALQN